jgi:hypothetical protein
MVLRGFKAFEQARKDLLSFPDLLRELPRVHIVFLHDPLTPATSLIL